MVKKYKYSDSVTIQISGPKTIIPEPVTELGRLGMTWLHFLNTSCGLQLDNNSDFFICTSTYSTIDPEGGWTANLNDQIKPFIDRYSRKRAKFCVRLHTGSEPIVAATDNTSSNTSSTPSTSSLWTPSILRKPTATVTSPAKKFAAVVPLTPSQVSSANGQFRKPAVKAGQVFVRPTPAIVIPTRGSQLITPIRPINHPSQVITPIQPVIPQPKISTVSSTNRNNIQTSTSSQAQCSTSTAQQGETTQRPQSISEVSLGRSNRIGEPSPPKLTRFDQLEQRNKNGQNGVNEPQPSTSAAAIATVPASPRNDRPKRATRPTRRFEEDGYPRIMSVGACKIEPVEIELEEGDETENGNLQHQNQQDLLHFSGIEDGEDGQGQSMDDLDNMSVCTAASVEERDLVEAGIPIRNMKGLIDKRLDRFDNSMLQRVQNEIKKLKQKGQWDRNVRRSPLACYLLQEVFKEPM